MVNQNRMLIKRIIDYYILTKIIGIYVTCISELAVNNPSKKVKGGLYGGTAC